MYSYAWFKKKESFFILLFFFFNLESLKIQRVILASDTNPMYLEFWPLVSKAWFRFGLKPTLAFISHEQVELDNTYGEVVQIQPIAGIPTWFHAQVIRLLLPVFFEEEACLTSDIDMLPLNKDYFTSNVKNIDDKKFIIYRDRAQPWNDPRYPICYLAAKGKIFKQLFGIKSVDEIENLIKEWFSWSLGWETDERIVYGYVNNCNHGVSCIKLGHGLPKRICRSQWKYDEKKLKTGFYIDSHLLRPYSEYKKEIDKLIEIIGL